jgi:hypothetical protein
MGVQSPFLCGWVFLAVGVKTRRHGKGQRSHPPPSLLNSPHKPHRSLTQRHRRVLCLHPDIQPLSMASSFTKA